MKQKWRKLINDGNIIYKMKNNWLMRRTHTKTDVEAELVDLRKGMKKKAIMI